MIRSVDGFTRRSSVRTVRAATAIVAPAHRPQPHRASLHTAPPAPRREPLAIPPPTASTPGAAPAAPAATPIPRRVYRAAGLQTTPPQRRRWLPEQVPLPLIIVGAMVAGVFAQSAVFGQFLVVAYGLAALIWNIASRTTFTLALLSMIATTILLIVRGNIGLAQNFATYTFLLLVVGVITLIRELKKEGGRVYNSRKNIN